MKLTELERYITSLFDSKDNEYFREESGITIGGKDDIRRIGYCTNLTVDTIEEGRKNNVNLIITHHDAWDFIFGLKDACRNS